MTSSQEEVIPARVRAQPPEPNSGSARGDLWKGACPKPTERYQTAEELGDAIQAYLDKPSASTMQTQAKEIEQWVKDGRLALAEKESLLEDAAILSHTIEMELANTDILDLSEHQEHLKSNADARSKKSTLRLHIRMQKPSIAFLKHSVRIRSI